MAYDLAPGDLIAHLAGALVEPLESLTLSYDIRDFGLTRGGVRSVLQMHSGQDLAYREGGWLPAGGKTRRAPVTFPGADRPSLTMKYAAGAVVTVPRHLKVRNVEVVMRADVLVPRAVAPALASLTTMSMRTPLHHVVDTLIDWLPEGPPSEKRARAAFSCIADAVGADGRRARGVVTGTDVYASSAVIAVEGLRRLVADGAPVGVLAPSQAFAPADFLDALAPTGLTWSVEGPFSDE